jgi:DNA mismatch repair protein MutL
MKISVLSHDVVNQIAAGEVVERPAHLIKELIENSLDAGATKIEVEFTAGGRNVRVSDNGIGIEAADLALALQRHATSKITQSEDLFALQSFGFRGEALASISAVSNLKLISRTPECETAFQVESQFGKISDVIETGANPGTSLVIKELFANMPARLKFLKSETAESTQIKQVLKAFALSHPEIEIRVKQDKPLFAFKAQASMLARAKEVLGVNEVYENEYEMGAMKVKVVFCSPHEVTGNSKGIWLFVQKRWVQDRSMQAAVLEAYRGLLMHGEYPQVIVDLQIDPSEVDVNIHPTKSQVKFRDPSSVFRIVQRALRAGLEKAPWIPSSLTAPVLSQSPVLPEQAYSQVSFAASAEFETTMLRQKVSEPLAAYFARDAAPDRSSQMNESGQSAPLNYASQIYAAPQAQKKFWSSLQVLGQAQQTYILTQNANAMVIVDQHAAHERVNYERLMKSWNDKNFEIQDFLIPLSLQIETSHLESLLAHQKELELMGLFVEAMGPEHLAVRAAPAILKESAIAQSLIELAHEIAEQGGGFAIEKCIMHIFATMACHSSVRAGQALSNEEMQALLVQMDEFALSSFCPHGRPVSVEYPFHKLERDFGRIV